MTLNYTLVDLNFFKDSFRSRVGKHILKGPDNDYFRLCRPDGLCHSYAIIQQQTKCNQMGVTV